MSTWVIEQTAYEGHFWRKRGFTFAVVFSVCAHFVWMNGLPSHRVQPVELGSASFSPVSVSFATPSVESVGEHHRQSAIEAEQELQLEVDRAVDPVDAPAQRSELLPKAQHLLLRKAPYASPAARAHQSTSTVPDLKVPEIEVAIAKPATVSLRKDMLRKEVLAAAAHAEPMAESASATRPASVKVVQQASFRESPQPPNYPRIALKRGWQGEVLIQALVDASGATQEIKLIRSSGYEMLDASAIAAVAQWQFQASMEDGDYVASWVEVPVDFTIRR